MKLIPVLFILLLSGQSFASHITVKSYVTFKIEQHPVKISEEDPTIASCKDYDHETFSTKIKYKVKVDTNTKKLYCALEKNFFNISHSFEEFDTSDFAKSLNLPYELDSYSLKKSDLKNFNLNPVCSFYEGQVVAGSCKCNLLTEVDNSEGFPKCVVRKDMLQISVNTCNSSMRNAVKFIANSKIDSSAVPYFKEASDCDKNKIIFLEKIENKIFKDLIFVMVHQQKLFELIKNSGKGYFDNINYLRYNFRHESKAVKDFALKYKSSFTDDRNLYSVLDGLSLIYWYR